MLDTFPITVNEDEGGRADLGSQGFQSIRLEKAG